VGIYIYNVPVCYNLNITITKWYKCFFLFRKIWILIFYVYNKIVFADKMCSSDLWHILADNLLSTVDVVQLLFYCT